MSDGIAVGSQHTLIICADSQMPQAPCPSGMAPATMLGYVINPAQGPSIEAQNAPFDYAVAAQIWGMAFTFIVALYLVSKSAGAILSAIKNF